MAGLYCQDAAWGEEIDSLAERSGSADVVAADRGGQTEFAEATDRLTVRMKSWTRRTQFGARLCCVPFRSASARPLCSPCPSSRPPDAMDISTGAVRSHLARG